MEVKGVEKEMGFMSHALLERLALGLVEVVGEDGLVLGVSALVDDDAGTLAGAEAADVGETLLGDNHVQVVLGLVDVGAHGNNTRDTVGVSLGRSRRGSVHDGVLGVAEEISRTTNSVEHSGAADTGRVGVGVDVNLDRGIHANDTETADDLGGVGNSLASEEDLGSIGVPVVVESLETLGGEADRRGGSVVEASRVKEVKEGVLDDLSPDGEVLELGLGQTTDDGVGDVANAGLERQEIRRHTAPGDLVLEELDQVAGDSTRGVVGIGVGAGGIPVVRLDDSNNLGGVNRHRGGTNAVSDISDVVRLAVGGQVGKGDVVKTMERGNGGVDLDDDL